MGIDIEVGLARPKIDVHCHVWNLGDESEEAKCAEQLIHAGDRLGITEFWCSSPISGGRLASIEAVREENEAVLRAMRRFPEHIRGYCFAIGGHYQHAVDEINRCLDQGMIGVKLYNQYFLSDPAVRPILEVVSERKVPLLEHAGFLTAEKDRAGQPLCSFGDHFTLASQEYPDAILIHAHIGGGGDWERTVRGMRGCSPNVTIDISGSNLDDGQTEFAVRELGADRVLFGTDGTMAGSVGKVLDGSLSDEEQELVFWGNAERILAAQGASPTVPREEEVAR